MTPPLRLGLLGAARITPFAIFGPVKSVPEVQVVAIAARDKKRAQGVARKHGIPRVHDDYHALLADPEVDAVYNPLPNSLHCHWTVRALEAGKHVLCEKPLAANAEEAARMAEASRRTGRVLMEAFHYRFHPLMARALAILAAGEIGQVEHIATFMCIPLPMFGDIRYRLDLAGGATMDTGCYALHMLRSLAGAEPEVVSATAKLRSPGVDRAMDAEFRFADGRTGSIACSLWSYRLLKIGFTVRGTAGELRVFNSAAPQLYHRLTLRNAQEKRVEKVPGEATYTYQLRAFAEAVRTGTAPLITLEDSLANMRLVDAVYRAAGLLPRGLT